MAQFDVYRVTGDRLVVDCQHDLLSDLPSRIVAPLRPAGDAVVQAARLNPVVDIDGSRFRIATQFLRAIERRELKDYVGSLAAYEYEIKAALDMLISGF